MGRTTLQTIADRVGVSRMTVSNAFSRPDQLSTELRNRILAVADKLGYVGPDPTARALASGTAGAVGLLLSETPAYALTDEVATAFLAGIADELSPTGLALTLLSATARSSVIPARDVALDGAVVYSCDTRSNAVDWLMRRKLPLVFVDQAPAPGIDSINVADRLGAKAAAEHITALGHRRVAIVTTGYAGPHGHLTAIPDAPLAHTESQRLLGWFDGLDVAAPLIVRLPHANPYDTGFEAGQQILASRPRPTAVLCFSDAIARGVMDAVAAAGLRVPTDISVVGFDDNPLSHRTQPTLTTVRQNVDAKGRAAATALLAAIERSKSGTRGRAKRIMLPTELVVRDSTARPRRTG